MNRCGRLTAALGAGIVLIAVFAVREGGAPNLQEPPPLIAGAGKPAVLVWPRKTNPLHAVIVFTKFKGESPGDSLAPSWASDLFGGKIGSVSHYFTAISYGRFTVSGECLPRVYEMPFDSSYYKKSAVYVQDILTLLNQDPSFNFAKYDNDGIDGVPNSGDDDGFVDYLVFMPRSRPYDFIFRLATGYMNLPLPEEFVTDEKRPFGEPIVVDDYSGALAVAATKTQAITILTAEIAHVYGAVDLMDKEYDSPENDSAGAGFWDVLAWGANGWGWSGVPMPPGAYNRILMGCAGPHNANIVDVYGSNTGLRIREMGDPRGVIYRLMISPDEYFLIEYRSNNGSLYYDYQIPRSGLLIWHVNERESNSTEETKLCDLECPDGKFRDAGFPKGLKPDAQKGGDNLDFWAHDASYAVEKYGNMGDAADVYDGVKYTVFGSLTNPNSSSDRTLSPTGIEVFNIRREGEEMVFDCTVSYKPAVFPPRLPIVGMGYQRSKNRIPARVYETPKAVYIASGSSTVRPELLVTVSPDSLRAFDVTGASQASIRRLVENFLLDGVDIGGARIVRENTTSGELASALGEFSAVSVSMPGGGYPVVQKLTLVRGSRTIPFVMDISQNYPNPFNAETAIPYILSTAGPVVLEVFDILGRKAASCDEGYRGVGSHIARFSADGLASGVYFYRISGENPSRTKRFVILK